MAHNKHCCQQRWQRFVLFLLSKCQYTLQKQAHDSRQQLNKKLPLAVALNNITCSCHVALSWPVCVLYTILYTFRHLLDNWRQQHLRIQKYTNNTIDSSRLCSFYTVALSALWSRNNCCAGVIMLMCICVLVCASYIVHIEQETHRAAFDVHSGITGQQHHETVCIAMSSAI
jgi:hypothetical protein